MYKYKYTQIIYYILDTQKMLDKPQSMDGQTKMPNHLVGARDQEAQQFLLPWRSQTPDVLIEIARSPAKTWGKPPRLNTVNHTNNNNKYQRKSKKCL